MCLVVSIWKGLWEVSSLSVALTSWGTLLVQLQCHLTHENSQVLLLAPKNIRARASFLTRHFPRSISYINEKSSIETTNVGLKSSRIRCNYTTRLQQRSMKWRHDGVDGGISTKVDALEAERFEQSGPVRKWESWTDQMNKALLHHSLYTEMKWELIPTGWIIST